MHRPFVLSALALAFVTSCTPAFRDRRTPSGDFCTDMPVIPAGEEPNLEYHRLQPVQSDIKARTEAERLESLRKAACLVGADAVVEAVNEETRNDQAQYVFVSSGTAVIWVRPKGSEAVPLTTHKKAPKPDDSAAPTATSEPPPAATTSALPPPPAPTATAVPTAAPVASAAPTAAPSAAPSASASAAPTSTGKSKLPTNAAPKPLKPKK